MPRCQDPDSLDPPEERPQPWEAVPSSAMVELKGVSLVVRDCLIEPGKPKDKDVAVKEEGGGEQAEAHLVGLHLHRQIW